MKKIYLIILTLILTSFLVSCNERRFEYDESKINIVTTTNIIADLAINIGGENVNVYNLMAAYVDPHGYLPRPSDLDALKQADIILASGLHLEAKMINIFENYREVKPFVAIGEQLINYDSGNLLIESPEFGGNYDPHFWFDINLYIEAAKIMANVLINYDSLNEQYYITNLNNYLEELELLKIDVEMMLNSLNLETIVLITAHDAFSYLENSYPFNVYALQGLSTEAEVSPLKIKEITALVTKYQVKAIFPENSVPKETITALKEAIYNSANYEINIGGTLASDSLGNTEFDNTYLKMYRHNIATIVAALGE